MKNVKKLIPGAAIALVIAAAAKFLESLEESAGLHFIGASVIAMFIVPRKQRTQFACSKVFVPVPIPTLWDIMAGMGPKESAKCTSSAAPVGVHSSP